MGEKITKAEYEEFKKWKKLTNTPQTEKAHAGLIMPEPETLEVVAPPQPAAPQPAPTKEPIEDPNEAIACGNCQSTKLKEGMKHCPDCGQELLWQ